MTMNWKVILEKDKQSGWFTVTVPSLPGCISQGDTKEEAIKNIKEAVELYLEDARPQDVRKVERPELVTTAISYA